MQKIRFYYRLLTDLLKINNLNKNMKKILNKIVVGYFIIMAIAIVFKVGDIYAGSLGDYPNQICTDISSDLIYGDTDNTKNFEVSKLQKFLVNRGFSIGNDTFGIFGYGTQEAVSKFQIQNDLAATGFVGLNTRNIIKNISCNTNTYNNLPSTIQISNIPTGNCGVNSGWNWNGRECVNYCDNYHPWDPSLGRCSSTGYVNYNGLTNYVPYTPNNTIIYNNVIPTKEVVIINGQEYKYTDGDKYTLQAYTSYSNNCYVYGYDYVFNGRYCVKSYNLNYCGPSTDNEWVWNGNKCVKQYSTKYLCNKDGKYYTDSNYCNTLNYNYNWQNTNGYNQRKYKNNVYNNKKNIVKKCEIYIYLGNDLKTQSFDCNNLNNLQWFN